MRAQENTDHQVYSRALGQREKVKGHMQESACIFNKFSGNIKAHGLKTTRWENHLLFEVQAGITQEL